MSSRRRRASKRRFREVGIRAKGWMSSGGFICLQAPKGSPDKTLMRQLYWLPVQYRIDYKVSALTYKTLNTSVPRYLNQRISRRVNARTLSSSATPLLIQPFALWYIAVPSWSSPVSSGSDCRPVCVPDRSTIDSVYGGWLVHGNCTTGSPPERVCRKPDGDPARHRALWSRRLPSFS